MKKAPLRTMYLLVLTAVFALAAVPAGAAAQAERAPAPETVQPTGIEVHGHWVIEVRDPDGSLVERREFENALTADGGAALAKLLARTASTGKWVVNFGTNSGPCSGNPCHIIESGSSWADSFTDPATNLDVVAGADGTLTLSGSETVDDDGTIDFVTTNLGTCGANTAPDACDVDTSYVFTQKTLETSVSVSANQVVSVTVTLSFS